VCGPLASPHAPGALRAFAGLTVLVQWEDMVSGAMVCLRTASVEDLFHC
jgi:hypothetical protein